MIKTAYLAVLVLAGLLAFGLFSLVSNTGGRTPQDPAPANQTASQTTGQTERQDEAQDDGSASEGTQESERVYFLRDIDLDAGEITLLLFGVGEERATVIVRDPEALRAAQDTAYINTHTTGGQALGSLALGLLGAPPVDTITEIYRDDVLIGSVSCTNTACGRHAETPDIDYAGLLEAAQPAAIIEDKFDSYLSYLATIEEVTEYPDFMFLNLRGNIPVDRSRSEVIIALPSVILPDTEPLDEDAHKSRIEIAMAGRLPEGATLTEITFEPLGAAVIGDIDNNEPVLIEGAPVPFPDMRFYAVRARIQGTASLPPAFYDAITPATTLRSEVDDAFAAFVTDRMQTTCVDCFFLKVEGPYAEVAQQESAVVEAYFLAYYDLREAP